MQIVVVGAGETGRLFKHYIANEDIGDEVVAFIEEVPHDRTTCPLGAMEEAYPPDKFSPIIAIQSDLEARERVYDSIKRWGYTLYTYVHPSCFVDPEAIIGEGCFIFEHNVIQSQVEIGVNTMLWSGNHIGHQTFIGNHCFISSHVVLCGGVIVGNKCFFGVNSAVAPELIIGNEAVIGMGSNILRNVEPFEKIKGIDSRTLVKTWGSKYGAD